MRGFMKRFLKEYALELAAGVFILGGVLLVVAGASVRTTILKATGIFLKGILSLLDRLLMGIGNRAATWSAAEATGLALMLLAAGVIVWRIRYRFHTGKRWALDTCPKCSSPIMRVHRKWPDRLLGATLLPEARRYRCVDPQCGWSGLLRRHIHHHHRQEEPVPGIEKN